MLKKLTEEQQKSILDAATREFGAQGFSSTSVSSIARGAGVSVGVIYKYYADKETLFLACIRQGMQYLEKCLMEDIRDDETPEEVFRHVIRANIAFSKENPDCIRMYNEITTDTGREWTRKLAGEIETMAAEIFRGLIEKAQEEGILKKEIDAGLFAFFFDNLMMMLHFAYCCDYYEERFRIFCGKDITDKDSLVEEQMIRFLIGAFEG